MDVVQRPSRYATCLSYLLGKAVKAQLVPWTAVDCCGIPVKDPQRLAFQFGERLLRLLRNLVAGPLRAEAEHVLQRKLPRRSHSHPLIRSGQGPRSNDRILGAFRAAA
jgi:hypothetical protein